MDCNLQCTQLPSAEGCASDAVLSYARPDHPLQYVYTASTSAAAVHTSNEDCLGISSILVAMKIAMELNYFARFENSAERLGLKK